MKQFRNLLLFIPLAFGIVSCNTDDLKNDIDDLKDRVTNLEAQVQIFNENLNALRVLTQDDAKTIKNWSLDQATGKYTIELSDGQTIVLTQGVEGSATTPDIKIGTDGYWYINGTKQDVKAQGSDAPTPEFRITNDGYWQVDLDGDGTVYAFEDVTNESGERVKATTSNEINMEDQFFKSVKEENGFLVVEVKGYDDPIKLPIDADLICEIVDPTENFKDNVLTVGYGKTFEITVKVKGDTYAVTAPAGWTAILGEPSADTNEATLSLTAPAQPSTSGRATADNTKDLTLQVNSGVNWAIDKIQVVAESVIDSYYELYKAGETLNIVSGISINKETYGEAKLVNSNDFEFTADCKVYFIEPSVEVNWTSTINFSNLILIGNKSSVKSKITPTKQIKISSSDEQGLFVAHNLEINAENVMNAKGDAKTYLLTQNNDNAFGTVIFDNTKIIALSNQPLTYIYNSKNPSARSIKKLIIQNSLLEFPAGTQQQFLISLSSSTATFPEISLVNNVFYSKDKGALLTKFKLFNGTKATIGNLKMHNNTIINLATETTFYVYAGTVNTIDVTKNLYYADAALSNNCGLLRATTFPTGSYCADNIVYKISSDFTWQVFYGGIKNGFEGAEENTIIETDPFEGGKFDPSTGTFVPNSTYSSYGATIE